MGVARREIVEALYGGEDPLARLPRNRKLVDRQGWNSVHAYLSEAIEGVRPRLVVDIGVWKGGSTIFMAERLKALGIDGVVLGVDTWLGAWDHWLDAEWFPSLRHVNGQAMLMQTFLANVVDARVADFVVPMQLDSLNAARVLRTRGVRADVIHIDAAHDYEAVSADLHAWWDVLRPGGWLIGDDYFDDERNLWPGVRAAFDEFFGRLGLGAFDHLPNKCRVRKPPSS